MSDPARDFVEAAVELVARHLSRQTIWPQETLRSLAAVLVLEHRDLEFEPIVELLGFASPRTVESLLR